MRTASITPELPDDSFDAKRAASYASLGPTKPQPFRGKLFRLGRIMLLWWKDFISIFRNAKPAARLLEQIEDLLRCNLLEHYKPHELQQVESPKNKNFRIGSMFHLVLINVLGSCAQSMGENR